MARHAYLGELEAVARPHAALFASGAVVELPLMFLRDIVLFPGEELPLRVLSDTNLEAIRQRLANEDSMLAVLCTGQGEPVYGTTVRVERTGLSDHSATLTGAAKQRFRLQSLKSIPGGRGIFGTVEILADVTPPPMPFASQWKYMPPPVSMSGKQHDQTPRRRRLRARFPSYWGLTEYAQFDAAHLIDKIQQLMISSAHCNWFRDLVAQEPSKEGLVRHLTGRSDQQDPVGFAFWVAANLPVKHAARLDLLKTECVIQLLRKEITLLEQVDENIYCSPCHAFLAHTRDIFSLENEGVAGGTFVNPGGFVHQIMTLRQVYARWIAVQGHPSTEDSWFPGYAWSVAHCTRCHNHLGWMFDAVEPQLSPARFFGFRRAGLTQGNGPSPTFQPEDMLVRVTSYFEGEFDSIVSRESSESRSFSSAESDADSREAFSPPRQDVSSEDEHADESEMSEPEEFYDAIEID